MLFFAVTQPFSALIYELLCADGMELSAMGRDSVDFSINPQRAVGKRHVRNEAGPISKRSAPLHSRTLA
jgi:hypothetical protein